ncbi:MAG: hypothetical protein ACRD0D_03775 [Acidimicrobiales bacterium]
MRGAVIAATPPTFAALLAFVQARSASRHAARERASGVAQSLVSLGASVPRMEARSASRRAWWSCANGVARVEGADSVERRLGA